MIKAIVLCWTKLWRGDWSSVGQQESEYKTHQGVYSWKIQRLPHVMVFTPNHAL